MPILKKRPPSSAKITKTAIEQATSALQDLPEKPREIRSLREAVNLLQESITTALARGYSYEEIAKMLTDKGVKTTASSLKRYLAVARRESSTTKPKRGKRGRLASSSNGLDLSNVVSLPLADAEEDAAPVRKTPGKRGPKPKSADASTTAAKSVTTRSTRASKAKPEPSEEPAPTRRTTTRRRKTTLP